MLHLKQVISSFLNQDSLNTQQYQGIKQMIMKTAALNLLVSYFMHQKLGVLHKKVLKFKIYQLHILIRTIFRWKLHQQRLVGKKLFVFNVQEMEQLAKNTLLLSNLNNVTGYLMYITLKDLKMQVMLMILSSKALIGNFLILQVKDHLGIILKLTRVVNRFVIYMNWMEPLLLIQKT